MLLIVVVLLLLVFFAPAWPYNREWGYGPFGGILGLILVIILIMWLTGNLGHLRI